MPESTRFDTTDQGTHRPDIPPLEGAGNAFKPMKLEEKQFEINLPEHSSPNDPITLFELYYTPEIIEMIVSYTNNYTRKAEDPTKPRARANGWYPTWPGEIYIYFAIRIYSTIHPELEITNYWNKGPTDLIHPISKYMAKDRFMELHMRFRVHAEGLQGVYAKVDN